MFQKKIVFRSAMISLVVCLLISCSFGVVASAADYSKIDIYDYVSGREFIGDDVIVSYDLPLNPWTELYAFATGSNTPRLLSSSAGNLYFYQGAIDEEYSWFTDVVTYTLGDELDIEEDQDYLIYTFPLVGNWQDLLDCPDLLVDDYSCPIIEWIYRGDVYNASLDTNLDIAIWFSYRNNYLVFRCPNSFSFSDIAFGTYYSFTDIAEYQRINGQIYPLGKTNTRTNIISVGDIKSGSDFTLSFDLRYYIEHDAPDELNGNIAYFDAVWLDKDFNEISRSQDEIDWAPYPQYQEYQFDIDFTVPQGAAYFYLDFTTGYFYVNTAFEFSWVITDITMSATLSSIEENSQTMGKVVYKLDQLDGKLDGVVDGLGDVKDVLQDTNDKLDDMQGTLEDLPGNIGDEFENVIDKENEKHESAGQQFVDQILDILPDSSTEIMAALRSLPDAMSYNGTEAVLQIPGIVMPAVGDLIPRTEIWSGAELDFSDYVELLPPTLLNLVRALFTIAIVLFCAYELKGIVSYCLTLKDNGRGA